MGDVYRKDMQSGWDAHFTENSNIQNLNFTDLCVSKIMLSTEIPTTHTHTDCDKHFPVYSFELGSFQMRGRGGLFCGSFHTWKCKAEKYKVSLSFKFCMCQLWSLQIRLQRGRNGAKLWCKSFTSVINQHREWVKFAWGCSYTRENSGWRQWWARDIDFSILKLVNFINDQIFSKRLCNWGAATVLNENINPELNVIHVTIQIRTCSSLCCKTHERFLHIYWHWSSKICWSP